MAKAYDGWYRSRRHELDDLVRFSASSATLTVLQREAVFTTDVIRAAIEGALHSLEYNGWIQFTPPEGDFVFRTVIPEEE